MSIGWGAALMWGARTVLAGMELALAPPVLYLALLSVAALFGARGRPARAGGMLSTPLPRFAVLVPAHDEADVIGGLLTSIAGLDYPVERRDVLIIADNCADGTAAIVRAAGLPGVEVRERHDERLRGKGHALRWRIEELERRGQVYDAYVVVDADSSLSPNFLTEMAAGLAAGAQVLQGRYRVENDAEAWVAGLRAIAFTLFNHLRPLGRLALGWSAGLKGNGMCFSRAVMERFGWGTYSLAEDVEYHLNLVGAGLRVVYAPAAAVSSAMPTDLRQARSQQERWERGRLVLARTAARGAAGALRRGDLAQLDAIAEVCLPPLSMLIGALVATGVLALALRWEPGLIGAGALAAGLAVHGVVGLVLADLSPRAYWSLTYAPWYIVWKIAIYGWSLPRRGDAPWVRTPRARTLPTASDSQ
ncbi:MAG TPA: glycosyltransferase family 2 protein [Ktedonobacterales bacterium]|jgi:GT2 family glycosyltransferase